MANPTAESIILGLTLGLNTVPGSENYAFNYTSSETCNVIKRVPFVLLNGASNQQVVLTDIGTLLWFLVADYSGQGFNAGIASGAGKLSIRANQFALIGTGAATTIFLDNTSGNSTYGEVIALGTN